MSHRIVILTICLSLLSIGALGQTEKRTPFSSVEDVEGLPRVLLLGDSISIGYTIAVQDYLLGKANVHRANTNCGPTTRGLEKLGEWLGDKKWDVVHFNFGLHDLKYMNGKGQLVDVDKGQQQVPPADYERNLAKIVERLKKTGARLVWRNTTPVPPGAKGRVPGDEVKYNEIASRVMQRQGVTEIDDLHKFAAARLDRIQQKANVHFTSAGSKQLALQVAKKIESLLPPVEHKILTATGCVFVDANNNRKFDSGEKVLSGVRVSNGKKIVSTDENGRYSLPVQGDANLFVIKPKDYRTPLSEDKLPEFYYLHRPHGSPVSYFPGVAPTGPLPSEINFPMYPQKEPETFKAIMFGDPQPRNQKELDYIAHDVIEELIGTDASFGVTLGDILFDDLSLFEKQSQLVALIGIPWYNVIGNHDLNFDADNDQHSDETFEQNFGPAYYSFDYGNVHFLVLDDVEWTVQENGEKKYIGGFGTDQLEFVKQDLAAIPENQLVVLMMHIPLVNVGNRQELYRLIENRPFCMSISGHTHTHEHRFIDKEDGWQGKEPHHHVINVTVSGAWWSGIPDERGIPHSIMTDGAPNGYSIISFDGNKYSLDFRAAGRGKSYQMQIHMPEAIPTSKLGETFVYANVFNGSVKSTVEFRLDGHKEWHKMEWANEVDPLLQRTFEREGKLREKLLVSGETKGQLPTEMSRPKPSTHLWKAKLPAGLKLGQHVLEVREKGLRTGYVTGHRTFRVTAK